MISLVTILRHERIVIAAGLVGVVVVGWIYLWHGAGMGMSARDMTTLSLFPHLQAEAGGSMNADWPVVIAMWWIMMIAMMTPSSAPLVLLYGLVLRRHAKKGKDVFILTFMLLSGYLIAWLAFAVIATAFQQLLEPAGLISEMMLWSRSKVFSALVLAMAGLYQLSPLKHACLVQCRSPLRFLTEYWRPGRLGSVILGVRHGAYCVGCCWMLMALLFVGGVMNLVWIAVLTVVVLMEKLLSAGEKIGKFSGGLLLIWAIATMLI
jgi:predicted metal-binding membrane protein